MRQFVGIARLVSLAVALTVCHNAPPPPTSLSTAAEPRGGSHDAGNSKKLVDAIREVAADYAQPITVAHIEAALDLVLVPEGHERHGKSRRWPVFVDMTVPRGQGPFPIVRLAIDTTAGLSLAQIDAVFGRHSAVIVAKETLLEFREPFGIPNFRVVASVLGGAAPSAPVVALEMERRMQPVPKTAP